MTHRADRLLLLSTYRRALRHHRLASPQAVRAASPETLAELGDHCADIVRLVADGHPDVMAALFAPNDDNSELWSVALVDRVSPTQRLLTFQYHCDDPEAERRMWAALRLVLRGG